MVETLRLGENCLKIGSGATPRGGKDAYLPDGPFSLIRSQNIYNDRFKKDGLAFISDNQARQLENVEVLPRDVLLNITGDSVARVCLVDESVLPARVNQHVAIIRPKPDRIDPLFLRYFLVTPEMQDRMLALASAGATRNALTKAMIENFQIPARDLEEQRIIAQTLGSLDDKIDLNRRMNETLEAMARAIFKDWFVDFGPVRAKAEGRPPYLAPELWALFPDALDDEDKPVGWRVVSLSEFAYLNPESWSKNHQPVEIKYVDLANTKWGVIETTQRFNWKEAPSRAQRILRTGDTIVGTVRPGNGSFSFIGQDGFTGSTGFAVLRPKMDGYREFVYLSATSSENIERLTHLADGAAYPAVRPDVVIETESIRPNEELLTHFSVIVEPLFAQIECNKVMSKELVQLRDLLLPKLMSGEIRLRDAEKAVEQAL